MRPITPGVSGPADPEEELMIEIKEVKTRREQREFVKLPLDLYKGDPYYVPMLYSGEFAIFKPDYPFNKVCDTVFYIACKDGRPVGRIHAVRLH